MGQNMDQAHLASVIPKSQLSPDGILTFGANRHTGDSSRQSIMKSAVHGVDAVNRLYEWVIGLVSSLDASVCAVVCSSAIQYDCGHQWTRDICTVLYR